MSYSFMLYRAAPDAGPLFGWESNQAAALGSGPTVQATLDALLPGLAWTTHPDGTITGTTFGLVDETIFLTLLGSRPGEVTFVSVAASPDILCTVMRALDLNCCCSSESGEMRDPFRDAATWDRTDRT